MIPLTLRSHHSLMWGTASVRQLCRQARRLGYAQLALTDMDNLYGLWPFLEACRQEGLTPIVGAEITDPTRPHRAVCLVAERDAYPRLCRLITQRHTDPHFDLAADLPAHAGGLIVLTTDADLLARWHAAGVTVAAAMPRAPLSPTHALRHAARNLDVPLVATPGTFFLQPEDHAVHCLLRAIALNTTLERLPVGQVAPANAWLDSPQGYAQRFGACPDAVAHTRIMAERITFRGPDFGLVMPPWQDPRGHDADHALRQAAYAGARRRYGRDLAEPVVERLEHELAIIGRMQFSAYFLVVRDIVRRSPRTCGRGSGAASLVAYCLGITNVCPVKHNLYFGRFLNPGRQDPPDIDVDFAWDERDGVIQGVLDQFGVRAAMVSSHILFQPRMAVRETAKVFGLPEAEIGRVTRRLPWFWRIQDGSGELLADLRQRPEAKALDFDPPWPEILALAQCLIGTPRHLAVHPGGVVITPGPIHDYVPVQTAPKGVPIIQWDKDSAESAGLVKIDLLGNRSLGVIRDAIHNIHADGTPFDETRWEPEEDPATRDALARGRTMGCFYIESPAMRLLQQKAGVGDFEHLVIHSSIIRPAANDCIQEYVRRLHGGPWEPLHPLLDDVLAETLGIMVYQEDVSRAAVALAGFDDVDADGLRKVMSKKDRHRQLQDYQRQFADGARRRGVAPERIAAVWEMMMSFSGYSFCKPHSASYARVSFQAAYLKVHFPAAFMAAVISNQGGFYSTFAYVSEARRLGVTLLGPDVQHSPVRWTGDRGNLRVGLMAVKGLTDATTRRIVAQHGRRPFNDPVDFLERIRPDEAEARALILCGALDSLAPGLSRPQLLWALARWQIGRRNIQGTLPLFADAPAAIAPPDLPPDPPLERLRREFKVLGFLCDRHPMTLFADAVRRAGAVCARDLPQQVGRRVAFAGWLITGKVVHTKRGDPMEFLTFEDDTGLVETTFFPQAYDRFCHLLDRNR
ncbi:MAG: DNA polymerase III subunit alpha, partial [Desulfatitalea sp.]|nr:DNA polymerase III subunit alpha [Desulfatitalea sp.]